jgi:hypothetical protein
MIDQSRTVYSTERVQTPKRRWDSVFDLCVFEEAGFALGPDSWDVGAANAQLLICNITNTAVARWHGGSN